jgi:hypothetical protein
MLPLCFLIPQCHLLCEQYPHNLQAAARVQLQDNTKIPWQPSATLLCFKLNRLDNTWRKKVVYHHQQVRAKYWRCLHRSDRVTGGDPNP